MTRPANEERDKEILQKKREGWTFRQIGRHYNITHTAANKARDRALRKEKEKLSTA